MATLRIPDEKRTITEPSEVRRYLAENGIEFERWNLSRGLPADATADRILDAYATEIAVLSQRGGYTTADVIDVHPHTAGLEEMLAKFSREHWHSEDEVRAILEGRGVFHIHPKPNEVGISRKAPVFAIEVEAGDLIRVPAGTWHWFDLCAERRIRAIRLFQDRAGWTPVYTDSGVDRGYQPVCLGTSYLPERTA